MERMTGKASNLPPVPTTFEMDFVMSMDDKTYKAFMAMVARLWEYEETGLTPAQIVAAKLVALDDVTDPATLQQKAKERLAQTCGEQTMDKLEMGKLLMACWPGSFIYRTGEFIAHRPSNTYLCFENCETMEDLNCKVLEWFSRAAHKTAPYYTDKSNNKFHRFMLDGINKFLGTAFIFEDMDLIYTYMGNACNHKLTVEFVRSGYNMELLHERRRNEGHP